MNMNKWEGKVAVVTGASTGIGADIAVELANAGILVVGLARRAEVTQVISTIKFYIPNFHLMCLSCI